LIFLGRVSVPQHRARVQQGRVLRVHVGAHGEGRAGVAKPGGDDGGRHAAQIHQSAAGVPGVVEADHRQSGCLRELLEAPNTSGRGARPRRMFPDRQRAGRLGTLCVRTPSSPSPPRTQKGVLQPGRAGPHQPRRDSTSAGTSDHPPPHPRSHQSMVMVATPTPVSCQNQPLPAKTPPQPSAAGVLILQRYFIICPFSTLVVDCRALGLVFVGGSVTRRGEMLVAQRFCSGVPGDGGSRMC